MWGESLGVARDSATFFMRVAVIRYLGCTLNRREGQRFFSSLVNGPHRS